jgi:hypothetical protein
MTSVFAISALLYFGTSLAATNTNTTLGITVWSFSFFKDTSTDMNSYFSHTGNQDASIDIWNYAASLSEIAASSSGDHRFTVSDMVGDSFTVTLQTSALTASWVTDIPASAITYTGTDWLGTGKALTATWEQNTSLDNPITFVARADNSWLSKYSQEITIKVQIPAAQAPASYTGQLTFTY